MGLFGIGTYQSVVGGVSVGNGFKTSSFQLSSPLAGVWGGNYGFVVDTTIRAPKAVQYVPAPMIGLDSTGVPVVRGYPQMIWSYSTLRSDHWYYFLNLYNQAGSTQPAFQYQVLLQYPAQDGSATPVQVLAHMDPPKHAFKSVGAYNGVMLTFTYLGQSVLAPGVPIITLS